jgi:ABC-2 type transport system permease protein
VAVVVTLVQFLINVIGQLWEASAFLRPLTVFYYYQPQRIILLDEWSINLSDAWQLSGPLAVNGIAVLVAVGLAGYGLALWTFCRRDLPAPL